MALTEQEYQEICRRVKTDLSKGSQGVAEIPIVETMENINSLPCLRMDGDKEEAVEVPIPVLAAPSIAAAKLATDAAANADAKAKLADDSAKLANDAAGSVEEAKQAALDAAGSVETVKADTVKATADVRKLEAAVEEKEKGRVAEEGKRVTEEGKRVTAESGRVTEESKRAIKETERNTAEGVRLTKETERQTKEADRITEEGKRVTEEGKRVTEFGTLKKNSELATGAANAGAANAEQAAIGANTAADNADKKATLANTAASNANDTADHPTYIGADHYVYKWNKTTKAYDKTDIYTKGDAFSVKKVYASVELMEADVDNVDIKEGDFVLVNTANVENPDNAKLYVKIYSEVVDPTLENPVNYAYEFLVDMSGAIGFTGKTPQLFIGTITTSEAGTEAKATVSENGTDSDGNPKYKLSFSIPRGNPGAPFQVKGAYATIEALKVAIPDGSAIEGFIAVGDKVPYDYYAWVNGAWMDHGKIVGDGGGKMVLIPNAVLSLTTTSTSNEILNAFGSKEAFIEIVTKIKNGAPAAILEGVVLIPITAYNGTVSETSYELTLIAIMPPPYSGTSFVSISLKGEIASFQSMDYAFGYADLANTLTKFQLVSDPVTGGTDKPASAEAVKVLNDKVEYRSPSGRFSPDEGAPVGWYRIAVGDAYPVAKTALVTIGSVYNENPPQAFSFLISQLGGDIVVKMLLKQRVADAPYLIDKVRVLAPDAWQNHSYIDIHYAHSRFNELLITATSVIGNTFYAIPQKVADTPPEGFTSIEFEI